MSRHHGVFLQQDDNWYLENLSPNGTFINGKRVRKKPVPVREGDMISVGDQQIFQIEVLLSGAAGVNPETTTQAASPAAPPISPASRKMRLWISLAIFWLVVLGILAFIQPLLSSKDSHDTSDQTPALTPEQISQAVRHKPSDIQGRVQPNERRMNEALTQARNLSSRLDASIDAPFHAYRAYQRAIAYSGQNILPDSRDMREFTQLERDLIKNVSDRYYDAYGLLRTHNFRGAEKAFRELIRYFPEPENPLIRNVEAHRRDIGSKLKRH
jgi:hypothetical protein